MTCGPADSHIVALWMLLGEGFAIALIVLAFRYESKIRQMVQRCRD